MSFIIFFCLFSLLLPTNISNNIFLSHTIKVIKCYEEKQWASCFFSFLFLRRNFSRFVCYMWREWKSVRVTKFSWILVDILLYIALALLMIDEPSFESSFIACWCCVLYIHRGADMRTDGEIPSFVVVGKNVLLLVGINHTGGWHYYGGDLLTCAHIKFIYTTQNSSSSSSSNIKYSYTYVKYLEMLCTLRRLYSHTFHYLQDGPTAKNTILNASFYAWSFLSFLSVAHPFKILFDSYFSSKNLLIHWKLKMTAYAMLLEVTKINRLLALAKLIFPIPPMCSGQKNFQTWSICWYQYLILFWAFSNRRSWREVVKFSEKWPSFNMFKVFKQKSPETLKMD